MKIMDFTVEEINLIAIYNSESKIMTMVKIHDAYPYMDDDMKEIAHSAVSKLTQMAEEEFDSASFIPADDEEV